MKMKISLIALAALITVTLTGCGIVKVVPIGEEAAYSGKTVFDSEAEAGGDWSSVASEISGLAVEVKDAIEGGEKTVAVKGTGKIAEFNTDTPKYYLLVEVDGYDGDVAVQVRAGGPNSSTAVRDLQTLKVFESFTNQTEWSQYGKDLNKKSTSEVIEPLGIDESVAGKTVTFSGAADLKGDTLVVTPVEMSIE